MRPLMLEGQCIFESTDWLIDGGFKAKCNIQQLHSVAVLLLPGKRDAAQKRMFWIVIH